MRVHDISAILGEESITYPGDPAFTRDKPSPEARECTRIIMCTHSGTHLDSPAHFFPEGRRLDAYDPADFVLPAQVIEILDPEAVRVEDLEGVATQPGEAILFRTGNSHSGRAVSGRFSDHFVYLTPDAAQWCVDRGLKLVGLDYISVDPIEEQSAPAHHILLSAGLLVLEAINLADVRPGRYTLVCLPLRIKDAESAPARAVLIEGPLGY